jgi:hypothetical protein
MAQLPGQILASADQFDGLVRRTNLGSRSYVLLKASTPFLPARPAGTGSLTSVMAALAQLRGSKLPTI